MKKINATILSLLLIVSIFGAYSVSSSDTTVTGSFTATGTLDVDVNTSTPNFGSIDAGVGQAQTLEVENNGNVTADVTQDDADHDSGNLAIGTPGSLGSNEYSVEFYSTGGTSTWIDIETATDSVIASSLTPTSTQAYQLRVNISSVLTYDSDANQFSADISVAAAS